MFPHRPSGRQGIHPAHAAGVLGGGAGDGAGVTGPMADRWSTLMRKPGFRTDREFLSMHLCTDETVAMTIDQALWRVGIW
jgi:hypothetical protein